VRYGKEEDKGREGKGREEKGRKEKGRKGKERKKVMEEMEGKEGNWPCASSHSRASPWSRVPSLSSGPRV
jgi:hypothetical protein